MATSEVELLKEMATGLEARLTEALEETEAQASRGMGIHPIFMSSGRRIEAFKEMLVEPEDPVILDWVIDIESQFAVQDLSQSARAGCSFQQTSCWERRTEDPGSRQRRERYTGGRLVLPSMSSGLMMIHRELALQIGQQEHVSPAVQ